MIAHLEPQVLAHIDWTDGTADYENPSLFTNEWRVVINTNGEFDAVWFNRITEERSRRALQHHIITWFVDQKDDLNTPPLYSEN